MSDPKLRPIPEIYQENAQAWDQSRAKSSFFEKPYMEQLCRQLSVGDEVLDIGCGSGQPIAEFFIKRGMKVTGVDIASNMIAIASNKYPQATWAVADMRYLNLDHQYAALIAWDSFFHLNHEEQEKMFPIFKRHLKPGGYLIFTSGPERGIAIGDLNGHALFHSSLNPDEYRKLLHDNGLDEISYSPNNPDCGGHTIWVCQSRV